MLEQVLSDLGSIQDLVFEEIHDCSDFVDGDVHIFREGRAARALLLLMTAGLGSYDIEGIKPVGVAIELLNLGIKKHFSKDNVDNMSLIVSDHYFATALDMVVALKDNWIVTRLSDALQEVSDGQVIYPAQDKSKATQLKEYNTGLKSRCAFYQSACEIGARSSSVPRPLSAAVVEFGRRLGMALEARSETFIPQLELADLIKKAYNALSELPAPAVCERIKEVTDAVVFS